MSPNVFGWGLSPKRSTSWIQIDGTPAAMEMRKTSSISKIVLDIHI